MNRRHVRLPDGSVRELAPGELVPEGAAVYVPLWLKDEAPDSDGREAVAEAYEKMTRKLANAWRGPNAAIDPEPPTENAAEAYEQMKRRLSEAWKDPVR